MKVIRAFLAAALAVVMVAQAAWAQQKIKPVALLVTPSYDELIADLDYLGTLANQPNVGQQLEGMLALFTGGAGLAGLDKTKPAGAVLALPPGQFAIAGFVPVKDLKQLLTSLQALIGEAKEKENGVYELTVQEQTIYVKAKGNWAWVSNSVEVLDQMPDSPQEWIAPLAKKYDLALQVRVSNIPEFWRQLAISWLREGFRQALEEQEKEQDDKEDDGAQLQQLLGLEYLAELIESLDTITLGLTVDRQNRLVALEVDVQMDPQSDLGKVFQDFRPGKETLASFAPQGAIVRVTLSAQFGPAAVKYYHSQIEQLEKMLAEVKKELHRHIKRKKGEEDEELAEFFADLIDDLVEIGEQTLEGGEVEAAISIENHQGKLFACGAFRCGPSAQKAAEVIRNLLNLAQERGLPVQFNAAKKDGVTYHRIPLGGADETLNRLFGESVALVVGTDKETVYFAFGDGAMKELQQRVASSRNQLPKEAEHYFTLVVSTRPLLELLQKQLPENETVAQLAQILPPGNKDQVRIVSDLEGSRETTRIEVDEAVLKVIIQAVMRAFQGLGQPELQEAAPPQF